MLDAGREAIGFLEHRTRDELDTDRMLTLALMKEIEIIGEAAYQMAEESRAEATGIHWPAIINMRHRLVHDYQAIDLTVLWKTIQEDLPSLVAALEAVLEGEA